MIAFSDRVEKYVPAKKGIGHVLRIVRDCLALDAVGVKTNFLPALDFAGHVLRRRSIVFLVSDFAGGAGREREVAQLARRHDVIAVRLMPPELSLGVDPAARGLVRLRGLENGHEVLRDFSSRAVRERYQESVRAWDTELRASLRRARVDRIDVPTHGPIAEPILGFFRKRERRASHG